MNASLRLNSESHRNREKYAKFSNVFKEYFEQRNNMALRVAMNARLRLNSESHRNREKYVKFSNVFIEYLKQRNNMALRIVSQDSMNARCILKFRESQKQRKTCQILKCFHRMFEIEKKLYDFKVIIVFNTKL